MFWLAFCLYWVVGFIWFRFVWGHHAWVSESGFHRARPYWRKTWLKSGMIASAWPITLPVIGVMWGIPGLASRHHVNLSAWPSWLKSDAEKQGDALIKREEVEMDERRRRSEERALDKALYE